MVPISSGYWGFDWADSYAKVGQVFPSNATIKLSGNNDKSGSRGLATAGVPEKYLNLAKLRAGSEATIGTTTFSKYPIKPKARVMVVNALSGA